MRAAVLGLPPHVVRKTEEIDLVLLPIAMRVWEDMKEQGQKFAPALDDVEIVEEDEDDEGLWC